MFRFHGHNLVPRAPLGFTFVWAFGEGKEAPREESLWESGAGWLGCPPHSYKCCLRSRALSLTRAVGGTSGCHGVLACRTAAAEGAQNTALALSLLSWQILIFLILHLPPVVPCGPSSWTPLRPGMKRKGILRALCIRMSSTSRSARRAPGRQTKQSWGAVLSLLVLDLTYPVSIYNL